jgi:hypothetical protein
MMTSLKLPVFARMAAALAAPFFDRGEQVRDDFRLRLRAEAIVDILQSIKERRT